jgi:hypothetical protein
MTFVHTMAVLLLLIGGGSAIQAWRDRKQKERRGAWVFLALFGLAVGAASLPLPY